jgi:hypothetical protein
MVPRIIFHFSIGGRYVFAQSLLGGSRAPPGVRIRHSHISRLSWIRSKRAFHDSLRTEFSTMSLSITKENADIWNFLIEIGEEN